MRELRNSSTILKFGTRWRGVVTFTPLPPYPRVKNRGTNWLAGWVGLRGGLDTGQEKNVLSLPGIEPRYLGRWIHSPVSLYWLSCPGTLDGYGGPHAMCDLNMKMTVFRDVTPCSLVAMYERCKWGICCFHLQGERIPTFRTNMLPPSSGYTSHSSTLKMGQHGPPKRWCLSMRLHGITSQKTTVFMYNIVHWNTRVPVQTCAPVWETFSVVRGGCVTFNDWGFTVVSLLWTTERVSLTWFIIAAPITTFLSHGPPAILTIIVVFLSPSKQTSE
jgi:hypothetical protein